MNFLNKKSALVLSIILILSGIFSISQSNDNFHFEEKIIQFDYSDFVNQVNLYEIKSVIIKKGKITGTLKNGGKFVTTTPFYDQQLINKLIATNVKVKVAGKEESLFSDMLYAIFGNLTFLFIFFFLLRHLLGQTGGKALSFGKFFSKKAAGKDIITFKDVAGAEEAKEELKEIVDFLVNPGKYQKIGAKMPKGVLLYGEPGTGKTLLARAVAGEAKCQFIYASGSEFVEMFVGVGASRIRDLFEQAKQKLPCIIFIDEFDSLGAKRGMRAGGGNDEKEQTLNELLTQLDGFAQNKGLVIFAATNRVDILDPAIIRAGRFDRKIKLDLPLVDQRLAILEVHAKKTFFASGVNLELIAQQTPGFSGADLANLINEAAILAAKNNQKEVTQQDLEISIDKITMGPEKRSSKVVQRDKELVAYHESGHALVAYFSQNVEPIHKVTIVPRGSAGGMVAMKFSETLYSKTKIYYIENLRVAMAGRAAEEVMFGKNYVTNGAYSDIRYATKIAKKMVFEFGMSKNLGMINWVSENDFKENISQETMALLDQEVKDLVHDAYEFALNFLNEKKDLLEKLGQELLKKESMTLEELKEFLNVDKSISLN